MHLKTWINPFERNSESRLISIGIILYLLGSLSAYLFKIRFDNFLHVAVVEQIKFWQPFVDNLIILTCLFIFLYITGRHLNPKTRAVDVLSTALIGHAPFYLLTFSNINETSKKATDELMATLANSTFELSAFSVGYLIFIALISLLILVWTIALLFNGFKTAVHAKTTKAILLFILALFVTLLVTLFIPLIY